VQVCSQNWVRLDMARRDEEAITLFFLTTDLNMKDRRSAEVCKTFPSCAAPILPIDPLRPTSKADFPIYAEETPRHTPCDSSVQEVQRHSEVGSEHLPRSRPLRRSANSTRPMAGQPSLLASGLVARHRRHSTALTPRRNAPGSNDDCPDQCWRSARYCGQSSTSV